MKNRARARLMGYLVSENSVTLLTVVTNPYKISVYAGYRLLNLVFVDFFVDLQVIYSFLKIGNSFLFFFF